MISTRAPTCFPLAWFFTEWLPVCCRSRATHRRQRSTPSRPLCPLYFAFEIFRQPLEHQIPIAVIVTIHGDHFDNIRMMEFLQHLDFASKALPRALVRR